MTDFSDDGTGSGGQQWASEAFKGRLAKRHRKKAGLKYLGLAALSLAFLMLGILLWT